MEDRAVASRARARIEDGAGCEAEFLEPCARERCEIDMWTLAARAVDPALDRVMSLAKFADDFLPHLETAGADRGSEVGERCGRREGRIALQRADGFADDVGGGAAPSGV